jgi:copper chaperone
MANFSVPDMSCGGCVTAVTRAVLKLDDKANVTADLATKIVTIDTRLPQAAILEALDKAGFPATPSAG